MNCTSAPGFSSMIPNHSLKVEKPPTALTYSFVPNKEPNIISLFI